MRLAADCNHDSVINTDDLAIIEQAGLLLSNVSQDESIKTSSVYCEYSSIISQDIPDEKEPNQEEKIEDKKEEKTTSGFRKFYENIISFFRYLFGIL